MGYVYKPWIIFHRSKQHLVGYKCIVYSVFAYIYIYIYMRVCVLVRKLNYFPWLSLCKLGLSIWQVQLVLLHTPWVDNTFWIDISTSCIGVTLSLCLVWCCLLGSPTVVPSLLPWVFNHCSLFAFFAVLFWCTKEQLAQ